MNVRDIARSLLLKGYSVSWRERSDGGILITKINGQTFKGAKGNEYARQLVGQTISTARKEQLKTIKPPKNVSPKARKLFQPSTSIKKLLRKVQRAWKKSSLTPKDGRITLKNVRGQILANGYEEATKTLSEALRYARNVAYSADVDTLIAHIKEFLPKVKGEDYEALWEVIDAIESARDKISWNTIYEIYQTLYLINDNISIKEVAQIIINKL